MVGSVGVLGGYTHRAHARQTDLSAQRGAWVAPGVFVDVTSFHQVERKKERTGQTLLQECVAVV